MIKFALRNNLKYPLELLIFNVIRDTESQLIDYFFNFDSLIYMSLMFLGEFFFGLIIYLYQTSFLNKNKGRKSIRYKSITLITNKGSLAKDSKTKIIFLVFIAGFFDFVQFMISLYTPKFLYISGSLESRLGGFLTVFDALFYYYVLKLPIARHQYFSLIIIGICLILVIITEFIFQKFNIFLTYGLFALVFLLTFVVQFCSAMVDSIEKYLFEYNHLNSFLCLLLEGLFGFILSFIHGLFNNPLDDIKIFKQNNSTSDFSILILLLILYLILSGLKNSFRVTTTKIYSPMTTTFLDYILNPFYMIYHFSIGDDFLSNEYRNYAYFFINLIISIIISFFGFVFNEFIILFCCKLEKDTHQQIVKRSMVEEEILKLYEIDIEEDTQI
jgi:hypothetical protein